MRAYALVVDARTWVRHSQAFAGLPILGAFHVKPVEKARVDYMFHFWGEAFLCALDGVPVDQYRIKHWQRLLGAPLTASLHSDAMYEARRFRELPECQTSNA
jgi:hypothetical protein